MQVQHPNGDIVEFPDGTSDEVVAKAMRQIDAEVASSKPAPPQSLLGKVDNFLAGPAIDNALGKVATPIVKAYQTVHNIAPVKNILDPLVKTIFDPFSETRKKYIAKAFAGQDTSGTQIGNIPIAEGEGPAGVYIPGDPNAAKVPTKPLAEGLAYAGTNLWNYVDPALKVSKVLGKGALGLGKAGISKAAGFDVEGVGRFGRDLVVNPNKMSTEGISKFNKNALTPEQVNAVESAKEKYRVLNPEEMNNVRSDTHTNAKIKELEDPNYKYDPSSVDKGVDILIDNINSNQAKKFLENISGRGIKDEHINDIIDNGNEVPEDLKPFTPEEKKFFKEELEKRSNEKLESIKDKIESSLPDDVKSKKGTSEPNPVASDAFQAAIVDYMTQHLTGNHILGGVFATYKGAKDLWRFKKNLEDPIYAMKLFNRLDDVSKNKILAGINNGIKTPLKAASTSGAIQSLYNASKKDTTQSNTSPFYGEDEGKPEPTFYGE